LFETCVAMKFVNDDDDDDDDDVQPTDYTLWEELYTTHGLSVSQNVLQHSNRWAQRVLGWRSVVGVEL